jgi:hypothetical protein
MKLRLATTLMLVVGLAVAAVSVSATTTTRPAKADTSTTWPINTYGTPRASDDVILKWDEQLLSAIRAYPGLTGPTITSRALGVLHTATYDAWAAYDPVAKITRPDGPPQQAQSKNTLANKKEAISYAAYRALVDLFPPSRFPSKAATTTPAYTTPDVLMTSPSLGYDPAVTTTNPSTAAGVGNLAAKAVLDYRHRDGSNQLGDTQGGTPGAPYSDYTGYTPVNQFNNVAYPWRWQPLCVPLSSATPTSCGGTVQKALTPQWAKILPFAASPAQYKVTGPPKNPDGTYSNADVATALADTSNLDDVKKAKAEYWADGPTTEFPPGHAAVFAQALSRKNAFSLDTDVKLFFALGNAEMDAGIGAWLQKYKYDFWRPITAIRYLYRGQDVNSWLGPNQGYGTVKGENWMPYQALGVVTPGFPEYVSGHSTFTAAGSIILMNFTSSDIFGASVTIPAHSSKFESNTPATDVTLSWPTFTAAADEAGWSRRYGGIHFYSGDLHGRMIGNLIGRGVYSRAQAYWQGTIGN